VSRNIENASAHLASNLEAARQSLEADRCALLVIDIQEKLLPPIFQKEQLVRNAQLLIRAAGVLRIPAIVSTERNSRGRVAGATSPD